MFGNISEVSIIVSAILAVAVGSVWYSPMFFGRILSKTTGHVFDDTESSRNQLLQKIVIGVLGQALFLVFVSRFILMSSDASVSLLHIGVFLTGFLIAHLFYMTILEKRSMAYFLIHAGYMAIVLFGGLAVIANWPW
jgi:hypothetical protein